MTPTYRNADLSDVAALARFAAATFVDAYRDMTPLADLQTYADTHLTPEELQDAVGTSHCMVVVAEHEGRIIGYAQVWLESAPDCVLRAEKPAQLQRIYVDRHWQGRGVASELMGRVISEATRAGCDVVWLAVWDANPRAIRFYQKSGFQVMGEQPFLLGTEVQRDFVMAWPPAG